MYMCVFMFGKYMGEMMCLLDMMHGVSSYFSMGQWQELEVQALIFRHMLTGSPVPPQLLNLLLNSNTNLLNYPRSNFPPACKSILSLSETLLNYTHTTPVHSNGHLGRSGAADPNDRFTRVTDTAQTAIWVRRTQMAV